MRTLEYVGLLVAAALLAVGLRDVVLPVLGMGEARLHRVVERMAHR